jgi:hypothetical protein
MFFMAVVEVSDFQTIDLIDEPIVAQPIGANHTKTNSNFRHFPPKSQFLCVFGLGR